MYTGYLQVVVQTVITFFVLLTLTRFLGKKQLSHLTFFNYVTGITIGSIAANMVLLKTIVFIKFLISLIVWCALTTLISYIALKSGKARTLLDGQPTIVIKKGKIDRKALANTKINLVLEPNGMLSILRKPEFQSTQKTDLSIYPSAPSFIPIEIITDGKLLPRNLLEVGKSREWLDNELKKANVKTIQEVLYAEIQPDGNIFIQKIE
ncbi:hypothetical protein B1B04_10185 [Lysinibacillus sp. KCTC 33748]|uniref:DUF421 domain-containing protein n=1 Tax=unclassified Lysinibacillus TaxID=2636778 RepID=UPI0009A6C796|nr:MULTISPECIES: DUF421 domain-containing protein [unclassified Lysinibacillus]OXS74461.1 hypothetical protein B1B04_10185 [Lysinibacillus sp. KCTC 33748]SKB66986.1 Uncharacterized membrane protein YcaP, DUF421 family [Lysinibacillus sp. AC-3]